MNNMVLSILSLIFTVVVTWYYTRKQMKKNEITHFSINSYGVGKGLHNVFPNFKLTFEGKEMSDKVLVLKGGFINTGRNDIIDLKNDSDIKIILPNGCSLREIQIKSLCSDLNVKACRNEEVPNIINFSIDEKFMSGESFEYIAIIESTEEVKDLRRRIEFKHRIANTSKIRDEYIVGQQPRHGSLSMTNPIKEKTLSVMALMVAIFLGLLSLSLFFQQKVQYYIYEKGSDQELSVYITPQSGLYVSDNELIPFLDNEAITKVRSIKSMISHLRLNIHGVVIILCSVYSWQS